MSKKIITNKQQTILTLLLTFRFLNSKQIQEFLNHKDHRRINSWLKDLNDKQYVERDFKPVYGILTKPAVYFLAGKGRKHLKESYRYHFTQYMKRISRDNTLSKAFRIRCQIIADWYLMLFPPQQNTDSRGKANKSINITKEEINQKKGKGKIKTNYKKTKTGIDIVDNLITQLSTDTDEEKEKIPSNTLQFYTPSYFPSFILLDKIKPDAYLRKRTTKGITHGLLFALDAYIPRMMLRYLVQRIFTTLDEEYWEEDSIHSLQIYILCPNNQIIIYLRRLLPSFLEKYYGGKLLQFNFTTRNQLYRRQNGSAESIKWITFSSDD